MQRVRRRSILLLTAICLGTVALAISLAWRTPFDAESLQPVSGLERMIGQMILVGFEGDTPGHDGVRTVGRQVAEGRIGGVMYLRRNARDERSVKAINRMLAAASPDRPPFIAIDQEGGAVERLTRRTGFPEIPSARAVAMTRDADGAHQLYASLAADLRGWGFNLNLGPVADIDVNPANPIIGTLGRSFSADAGTVAAYGDAFVRAHRANGVMTAVKHFPGHGSSLADSHETLPDVTDTWSETELRPFRDLIAGGGADMVMIGHIYNERLQNGAKEPASLSRDIIEGLLRRKLGYSGVVISDDLQMAAIEENHSLRETVVRAVEAGTDILLFSNSAKPEPDLPKRVAAILLHEAGRNGLVAENIAASYKRIAALKDQWRRATSPPAG
jgi:beta-N-acetylhexosaminidase